MAKSYSKFKTCNTSSNTENKTRREKSRRKDKKFLKKLLTNYNPEEIDEIYEDYELNNKDYKYDKIKISSQGIDENNNQKIYLYKDKYIKK